jgi:uncharacterized protein (TIGR03083 family)
VGEVRDAYAGCRSRIAELTAGLDDQRAALPVPACPEWTVHDVVAHVAGVVDDVLAGRVAGVATEPWTAAQVEARRARPIAEILDEWAANAPAFEEFLDSVDRGRQAVADVATHEHDVRAALSQPGARASDGLHIGLGFVATSFVDSAAARGIVVRVRTTDGVEFGERDGGAVLTGDSFELFRAMTGRRSLDQLRGLQWQGDSEAVLPAFTFGPFRPAAHAVDE